MNPFLVMEQHKENFTQNDLRIYQAILEKPEQVTYQSTSKLAEILGVSQPALTRFIKGLGYAKYQDFRSDITAYLATRTNTEDTCRMSYFERLEQLLKEAEQVLTEDYMNDLAGMILKANRICATGIMKSAAPAFLLQALMRKHDCFVEPVLSDSLRDTADHLTENDLIIVFSVSAQGEIMEKLSGTDAGILLVTANAAHRYQDVVTRTVVLPYLPPDPELCPVSPVLFSVFAELLDAAVSRRKLSEKE